MQLNVAEDKQALRIPLIGTEFGRTISSGSSSTSASGIVGIGVVGVMIVGYTASSGKDQRLINIIPEKVVNPFTGNQTFFASKRPGFAALNTPGSGIGTAVHVWSGKSSGTDVISAFGGTNSTVYDGTNSLGTTSGVVNFIDDTLVGTTANLVMTTRSSKAYFYPNGGSLTQITDVDFPGIAGETLTGRFAFLNGYNYIMSTLGKIYNSDINSLSSWQASAYLSANMSPDTGIGLFRYKDKIGALGKNSLEFYNDVGNGVGSPLQRISEGYIGVGCVNQYAYAVVDDTMAWIGSTEQSGIGLYMLEGGQAKKMSTPTIEAFLASGNPDTLILNIIKLVGKTLVVIVSGGDGRTYVYAVEDNMWHEWSGTTTIWQHMAGISSGVKYVYAVTEANTGGKVYYINPTSFSFQDDSVSYPVIIQTSKIDLNNQNRKFLGKLRVIGDQQATSTTLYVSYSDDDYQTWSTPRSVDMSNANAYLSAMGSFLRRAFVLSCTTANPLRLEALELNVSQGYR